MKKNIICCGNMAFDLIITSIDPKNGISFQARPGGSVLNTAILLSRLGLSASILAKTGKDFLSDTLFQFLRSKNLKTKYIIQDKRVKTALAVARLDKKGNSSYIFYRSSNKQTSFKNNQFPSNLFKDIDVFHTGSTYSYDDFTFENTLTLVKLAKKENVFISYDPNWRTSRIKDKEKVRKRIQKIITYVDLLKLSESDVLGITGRKTLSGGLKCLRSNIVVTLGDKGSFFWDGKKRTHHNVFKVKVIDTIGAGDAFTAGLIYRYCQKGKEVFAEEKNENLTFASAVSALVCTGRGATEGLRNLKQVMRFLKSSQSSL